MQHIKATLKTTIRNAIDEYRYFSLLNAKSIKSPFDKGDNEIQGEYLVSSEKGIFRLDKTGLYKVCAVPAFGIALSPEHVYLATWKPGSSIVLKGQRHALFNPGKSYDWQELYSVVTLSDAGRIHQIDYQDGNVWLANTAKNSYTKISAETGEWQANVQPFSCTFGHPISGDHNHVNSVSAHEQYLLFSAFKINRQAAFGVAGEGKLNLFAYRNMGVHDCILTGSTFWFSDSYRFWDEKEGGVVVRNGVPYCETYFDKQAAEFVRGIAGYEQEVIIGNSHAGDGVSRFAGNGALFVAKNDKITGKITVPFAQIYDVIRCDGKHFEAVAEPQSFSEVKSLFESLFGPPVLELPLVDVLAAESAKKFDERDIGNIGEYL